MKQIVQDLKSGETILENVPVPMVRSGCVLIRTHRSLVSLGTERMLVEFGKANYLDKARQQPDKVKMVLNKIKSDGLKPTLDAVFRKLGEPMPLGYCNAGEVLAVGDGVQGFQVGDRVISNGQHAEAVCIPENLVAKIPEGVSYEEAVFTVIGAIALQGIRLVNPTFGETVVVTGLGLIGLIAGQLLKANGCNVIGLDFDQKKVDLAKDFGIDAFNVAGGTDPVQLVMDKTGGVGTDAVLITASTKSNDVISQAANMSRQRGRIVLVGVIGLDIQRADFYNKELSFQVSCSYGPGRYDSNYEDKGMDYPIAFVRWTEKRNFETILSAIENGSLKLQSLITHRVPLDQYQEIYADMKNPDAIASILEYDATLSKEETTVIVSNKTFEAGKGNIGIIGAGNFTKAEVVPNLKRLGANVKSIASARGLSGTTAAKKFGIAQSTTNYRDLLADQEIDAVIITTQHNLHAEQVLEALRAGKHVFVEKPLAMNTIELDQIISAYHQSSGSLAVGFNRRFSPFIQDAKKQLGQSDAPINVIATMNAGAIPKDHWTQDMEVGGGRIVGEACHLIDLITYLTGSRVEQVVANNLGVDSDISSDNVSIILKYANGAQGVINYFANGNKAYSKERVEVYSQGRTMVIDNFRKSKYFGFKSSGLSKSQDKGHNEQFRRFVDQIQKGGDAIIPFEDIVNTTKASFAALESIKTNQWVKV